MVPEGDRESASSQHGEKKNDLKSINAKEPEVRWYGRDRKEQRPDQKRAHEPIDSMEGNLWKHGAGWLFGGQV